MTEAADSEGLPPHRRPPEPLSERRLLALAAVFYGLLLGVALAWRSGLHGESLFFASAAAAAAGPRPLSDALAGLLGGVALLAASRQWTRRTQAGARLARELAALLGRLGTPSALALALLSGVAEEAFFRGALQPRVGLVPAALLFGLAHYAPRHGLRAWAPAAAVAGLVLGGLYAWTGNLVAPVIAHALVNALNLRWLGQAFPMLSGPGAPPSSSRSSSSRIR